MAALLTPELPDALQCNFFTRVDPEWFPSLAALPSATYAVSSGPQLQDGDAAIKFSDGTQHLPYQTPRGILSIGGKVGAAVGSNHLAAETCELLENDLRDHEVTSKTGRVLD